MVSIFIYKTSFNFKLTEETRIRRLKLYRAALDNDWEAARCIYNVYKVDIQAKISVGGDTTLHIAAAAKNTNFAKELLKIVNKRHLGRTNYAGNTALFLAAASGNVELVTEMMGINKAVAMIEDYHKRLPIHMAASSGDKCMVWYLYRETKDSLNEKQSTKLLFTCIENDLYGKHCSSSFCK